MDPVKDLFSRLGCEFVACVLLACPGLGALSWVPRAVPVFEESDFTGQPPRFVGWSLIWP